MRTSQQDWDLRSESLTKLRPHKILVGLFPQQTYVIASLWESWTILPPCGFIFNLHFCCLSNACSAHLDSNHNHRSTFINSCTGTCFWSTRSSCAITKGQLRYFELFIYLFLMFRSLILPFKSWGLLSKYALCTYYLHNKM